MLAAPRVSMAPRVALKVLRSQPARALQSSLAQQPDHALCVSQRRLKATFSPQSTVAAVSTSDDERPPKAALFERVAAVEDQEDSSGAHCKLALHRPQRYAALAFKKVDKEQWKAMDRSKFRMLLEDCMATSTVSAPLRKYLDEYPIMDNHWSDQELVLIVGALIKSNRSKTALAVLKNQITEPSDRNRLNRVAAESARLGNAFVALGVLDIAKHFHIEPDVVTYTSAIHACARGGRDDIVVAFSLLEEMVSRNVTPNHRTYGAVVLAYARLNRWEDIEDLLESIPYDEVVTKSDVFASAITTCSRNRQFVVASELFAMVIEDDVYLGEKVSNAALSACARTSDLKQMDKIMAYLRRHSKPSLYTYNTMISAYGNASMMESALEVYERLQKHGLSPDVVTFNALLLGARRSRRQDLIPTILDSMTQHGIKWDAYTLNGLLEMCQVSRDVEAANTYWHQATEEQGLRLDRTNFETLLGVYFEAGAYQSVINQWRYNLTCRRRAKSAKTLNFLLRACSKLGDVESATALLEGFLKRGQVATAIAQNHILSTYLQAGDWGGAQKQLQMMAGDPALITTFAFTAVMKYAMDKQQYAQALQVFDDFHETLESYQNAWCPQLQYPPDALFVMAANAAMKLSDHERLVRLYQYLPATTSVTVKAELGRLVLASCEKQEDWRCAVSLYDELSKIVDDDMNVEFYEVVVKVVARAGEFERALDVNGGSWYRQNRPDQGWF